MLENADTMFYYLGYSQIISTNKISYYKHDFKGRKFVIVFNTKIQNVQIVLPEDIKKGHSIIIDKEEIEAINQKCKEMGWF